MREQQHELSHLELSRREGGRMREMPSDRRSSTRRRRRRRGRNSL
jgi:hypothetical protein